MEGLDLFTPVVTADSSSDSSDSDWASEGGSDSDCEASRGGKPTSKGLKMYISTRGSAGTVERSGSPVVDVEGDVSEKDFEIEKV